MQGAGRGLRGVFGQDADGAHLGEGTTKGRRLPEPKTGGAEATDRPTTEAKRSRQVIEQTYLGKPQSNLANGLPGG